MLTTSIYTLSEPDGTVRYVGKSDNPKRRLTKHLHEARTRHKNRRDKWIYSLLNKGLRPIMTVIEVVSIEAWVEKEKYWINHYLTLGFKLVNGSRGGEGGDCFRNRKHSEETKEKIRNKSKCQDNTSISGAKNKFAVFSEKEVIEIRNEYKHSKTSYQKLAAKYGVKKLTISRLITQKTYKNIL